MGKLPKISERFTDHPWNLYWLCYKELGKQDPRSLHSFPCNSIKTGPKQPLVIQPKLVQNSPLLFNQNWSKTTPSNSI
jgi:hypothetical protein